MRSILIGDIIMKSVSRFVEYICPPKNIIFSFLLFDCMSSNFSKSERLSKKVFQWKGLIQRGLEENFYKRNMMLRISIIA